MRTNNGMTLIVKTVTRLSVWLIILYGIYIALHGHITPGGGFAGGVIISLALLNVMLAYGRKFIEKWLNISILHDIESTSAIIFLIIGVLGIATTGSFLANFIHHGTLFKLVSAGTIPILNIVVGAKVSAALFVVVWTMTLLHVREGGQE